MNERRMKSISPLTEYVFTKVSQTNLSALFLKYDFPGVSLTYPPNFFSRISNLIVRIVNISGMFDETMFSLLTYKISIRIAVTKKNWSE